MSIFSHHWFAEAREPFQGYGMFGLLRGIQTLRDTVHQISAAHTPERDGNAFVQSLEGARRGARPIEGPVSPLYLRSEAAFPGFVEDALRLTVADS
ncbi:hypothetical protein, partial [Ensifer sp. ENS02]|uniref:hypothetical protein n=1 Tax=Ensifer sp. ENS02 TaxID=2769290 RepID=UPI001AEE9B83